LRISFAGFAVKFKQLLFTQKDCISEYLPAIDALFEGDPSGGVVNALLTLFCD
jgi:hypothetical protein